MNNSFFSKISSINQLKIPSIDVPLNIRIYWFQAHSNAHNSFSLFFKPHIHSFHETHFIFQGSSIYEIDGKRIVVSKGQYIMIPAKVNHTHVSCSDDLIRVSMSFDIVADENNPLSSVMSDCFMNCSVIYSKMSSEMEMLINLISAQSRQKLFFSLTNIKFEIFALITTLYHAASKKDNKSDIPFSEESITDTRYILAKKYINDNISFNPKIKEVASYVHLSSKQLNRLFLKYKKVSAFDYISEKRNMKVKELLLSSDLSLQEISEKTCFANEFYFNRYFKKRNGITPAKFRIINGVIINNKERGSKS